MLPLENRLKKVRDFNLVTKYGRWINGTFLDLKVLDLEKNKQQVPAKEDLESFKKQLKLAFAVGLKISKKAVVRNRLRRQLREAVRLAFKASQPEPGFFVLVVAKKESLNREYGDLEREVTALLRRAGLCKMPPMPKSK